MIDIEALKASHMKGILERTGLKKIRNAVRRRWGKRHIDI